MRGQRRPSDRAQAEVGVREAWGDFAPNRSRPVNRDSCFSLSILLMASNSLSDDALSNRDLQQSSNFALRSSRLNGYLSYGIFVDPPFWKRGVGRLLFEAAVGRAKELKAGALMIHAEPSAEGFYKRMGAIRIGEGPFYYSPELILPHLLYIVPRDA